MKVKKKVAALCLAAVVATSVGASAGGVYGHWQTRTPNSAEGGAAAWSHGLKDEKKTVYSYYRSAWSEMSAAMVFYNVSGVRVDSNINARAEAIYNSESKLSSHEEF
jgi:hypothetical protein